MLIRFSVRNFASFRERQEFNTLATHPHPDTALRPVPGTPHHALPVLALLGANGAGKSSLIVAVAFAKAVVAFSYERWLPGTAVPRVPFLLDGAGHAAPTEVEAEFVSGGARYRFAFACDDRRFTAERLHLFAEGRPCLLYERTPGGGPIRFSPLLTGPRRRIEAMTRPNSLYLSTAAAHRHPQLTPVHDWFAARLAVATERNLTQRLVQTHRLLAHGHALPVLALARHADPTFDGIRVTPGTAVEIAHRRPGGGAGALPARLESGGTRAWLGIVGPAVHALRTGGVLLADELDARLHPHLTGRLVRLFQTPATNPNGAQLLLSARNTFTLHADQIRMAEKAHGATTLSSLTA